MRQLGDKEADQKLEAKRAKLHTASFKTASIRSRLLNHQSAVGSRSFDLCRPLRQEIEERREEKEELLAIVANSRGRELEYQQRIQGLMKELDDADGTLPRHVAALKK